MKIKINAFIEHIQEKKSNYKNLISFYIKLKSINYSLLILENKIKKHKLT
jgi:hypothetical protein